MKTIVLASHNPVKIQATRTGFQNMFPNEVFEIRTVSAPSGVGDQPMSSAETLLGAQNRAENASLLAPEADYWIGIEGGVEELDSDLTAFAWVFIRSKDGSGKSKTGTFFLPPKVARLVRQGKELGEADDIVFAQANSKQANGAIGLLTGDVVDRTSLYAQAVVLALVPFRNVELFAAEGD
jgi:inosine/xanthosine triphosphatase